MKYYVEKTEKYIDGTIIKVVVGDRKPYNARHLVYIRNHEVEEDQYVNHTEEVFNHPIKTERAAKMFMNKVIKNSYEPENGKLTIIVKEYPDEISYDQFKAFICW